MTDTIPDALESRTALTDYSFRYRATEYAGDMLRIKNMFERQTADQQARHGRESANMVAEIARLQEISRNDAEIMRDQQRRLEKYEDYNASDIRTMRSLSAQNKALKQKNKKLLLPETRLSAKKRGAAEYVFIILASSG
jgi:hypothetical protein